MLRRITHVVGNSRSDWIGNPSHLDRVSQQEVRMALDAGFSVDEVIWMLELPERFTIEPASPIRSGSMVSGYDQALA